MTDYQILTPATVPAYIAGRPELAGIVDTDTLEAAEVGDGNLNLVFVCKDANGKGICLKQSLPYVRLVGESWPLTPQRVVAEARGLAAATAAVPDLVPTFYGLDRSNNVIAMENLMGWSIWRGQLNDGEIHRGVAAMLGRYVANVAFTTSLFSIDQMEIKQRTADAINPELCKITEDLVFTEPYIDVPNNSFVEDLTPEVMALRNDARLRAEVGMLKYKFMTAAQALVHGDLHTGSVMVRHRDDGSGDARVIDPEFAYYGPVGFDLGAVFANFLTARARAVAMGRSPEFQEFLSGLMAQTWNGFESEMRRLWTSRLDSTWTDSFLDAWLHQVQIDTLGFGGCKAIRRIIGLAKVSDIQTLPPDQLVPAATIVLRTASRWIKERSTLVSADAADKVFGEAVADVLPGR